MIAMLSMFGAADAACVHGFLGLIPWYQYLDVTKASGCEVQNFTLLGSHSGLLLVALAIVDDLIRVAALVAIGYVIYGGIQYVTSQGSPDGTTKARQTIINALIGVAIAILAATLVAFIGNRLAGTAVIQ